MCWDKVCSEKMRNSFSTWTLRAIKWQAFLILVLRFFFSYTKLKSLQSLPVGSCTVLARVRFCWTKNLFFKNVNMGVISKVKFTRSLFVYIGGFKFSDLNLKMQAFFLLTSLTGPERVRGSWQLAPRSSSRTLEWQHNDDGHKMIISDPTQLRHSDDANFPTDNLWSKNHNPFPLYNIPNLFELNTNRMY